LSDAGYLLDTNVISETRRKRQEPMVVAFLRSIDIVRTFVSVLTIGELRKGAALRRRLDRYAGDSLDTWIDGVEVRFVDRILPVGLQTARLWGELSATRPRPAVDTLIAATALARNLTLVTRNMRDVADTGVIAIDPWKYAS
jgi:predicted nucleic acid-binding protein